MSRSVSSINDSSSPSRERSTRSHVQPYRKKRVNFEEPPSFQDTKGKVKGLILQHQEAFEREGVALPGTEESFWQRYQIVILTAVPIVAGILVSLTSTILSWQSQTIWHNVGQSVSIALMCCGAGKAAQVYRKNQMNKELRAEELQQKKRIAFTLKQMAFLQECTDAIEPAMLNDYGGFPAAYIRLQIFMTQSEEGIVFGDLQEKWDDIGDILEEGRAESKSIDIEKIRVVINRKILPRISHYSGQLHERLVDLGHVSVRGKEKGESEALLGLSPVQSYRTGGPSSESSEV